jgi:hypothetical protein
MQLHQDASVSMDSCSLPLPKVFYYLLISRICVIISLSCRFRDVWDSSIAFCFPNIPTVSYHEVVFTPLSHMQPHRRLYVSHLTSHYDVAATFSRRLISALTVLPFSWNPIVPRNTQSKRSLRRQQRWNNKHKANKLGSISLPRLWRYDQSKICCLALIFFRKQSLLLKKISRKTPTTGHIDMALSSPDVDCILGLRLFESIRHLRGFYLLSLRH